MTWVQLDMSEGTVRSMCNVLLLRPPFHRKAPNLPTYLVGCNYRTLEALANLLRFSGSICSSLMHRLSFVVLPVRVRILPYKVCPRLGYLVLLSMPNTIPGDHHKLLPEVMRTEKGDTPLYAAHRRAQCCQSTLPFFQKSCSWRVKFIYQVGNLSRWPRLALPRPTC